MPASDRDAGPLSTALVFTATRVPVDTLVDYLTSDHSVEEFLNDFPSVERWQVEWISRRRWRAPATAGEVGSAAARGRSAALVAWSPERGNEVCLIHAAKRRRQQRLLGRRGERFRIGGEPRRHLNAA